MSSTAQEIASLLKNVHVNYLTMRDITEPDSDRQPRPLSKLRDLVLQCNPEAFDCNISKKLIDVTVHEKVAAQVPQNDAHDLNIFINENKNRIEAPLPARCDDEIPRPAVKRKRTAVQRFHPKTLISPVNADDAVKSLTLLLERYCERVASADVHGLESAFNVPTNLHDMKLIILELSKLKSCSVLHTAGLQFLHRVMNLMDLCVQKMHKLQIEEPLNVTGILIGLEAIHGQLVIMSCPQVPKQVFSEEAIDRLLQAVKYNLVKNLFPEPDKALNAADHQDLAAESVKGAKRKSIVASSRTGKDVQAVLDKFSVIISSFTELLEATKLSDSVVLQLSKMAMSIFSQDNYELLQLKSVDLMMSIFQNYPEHRHFIMDEIMSMIWKSPKKKLRSYHLPGDKKQIQILIALLILLIQSASEPQPVTSAATNIPKRKNSKLAAITAATPSAMTKTTDIGLEQVKETTLYFWRKVLTKWGSSKPNDDQDGRVILENIVSDLLDCMNLPEFPAAAYMLQVFCILIMKAGGLQSTDHATRASAVDLLGQVLLKVKLHSSCQKEKLWILDYMAPGEKGNILDSPPDFSLNNCIQCSKKFDSNKIACIGCGRPFHRFCVSEEVDLDLNQEWLCVCCKCDSQMEEFGMKPKGATKSNIKNSQQMYTQILLQQILLNFLSHGGSQGMTACASARRFQVSWWQNDDRVLHPGVGRGNEATVTCSRDLVLKVSAHLASTRPLMQGFDKILDGILVTLQDQNSAPRTKALKALSNLIEADPSMLEEDRVKVAVEGRFLDHAISVREAAVDLVGKHMMKSVTVALKYFDKIVERIRDTGLSVRKKVVKTLKEVVLCHSTFPRVAEACTRIIERISDDEPSIRDMVLKAAQELWFEDASSSQMGSESMGNVGAGNRVELLVQAVRGSSVQIPQIVAIVKKCIGSEAGMRCSASRQSQIRSRCEEMCRYFLEGVLRAFDSTSVESEVAALPYVMCIQVFCMADPTLCSPASDTSRFAAALEPYLKLQSDQVYSAPFVQSVVYTINAILPLMRRPSATLLQDLEKDLRSHVLSNRYLSVVQSCIKCLCTLGKLHSDAKMSISSLIRYYFNSLDHKFDGVDEKARTTLIRNVFNLGNLTQHYFEAIVSGDVPNVSFDGIVARTLDHVSSGDVIIKSRSLQGLGFILIAQPQLMLDDRIRSLLEQSLLTTADASVKKQTLTIFLDYLHSVESKLAAPSPQPLSDDDGHGDGANVPVAAGAGDINNNCGGIMQLYWRSILDLALDKDKDIRQAALKVMEVVLREGLVLPTTCVPTLVALEVDPCEMNFRLAHKLIAFMSEKYPRFLESKLGDGLQQLYNFVSSDCLRMSGLVNGVSLASTPLFDSCLEGVSRVYRLIRNSRTSRNSFMGSIVRKFDNTNPTQGTSLPFLSFCSEILSSLPFEVSDEPLYLIHSINRIVQLRSGVLLHSVTSSLCDSGRVESKGLAIDDDKALDIPQIENGKVSDSLKLECEKAMAMTMLLLLKAHLKRKFGLGDERCQSFQPSDAPVKSEVMSKHEVEQFSCRSLPLYTPNSLHQATEQCKCLKRALKMDSVLDFCGFNAGANKRVSLNKSLKDMEPSAASARKRRQSSGTEKRIRSEEGEDDEYYVQEKGKARRKSTGLGSAMKLRNRIHP